MVYTMILESPRSVESCRFAAARGNVASTPNSGVARRSMNNVVIVNPGHGRSLCNGQARWTKGYIRHSDCIRTGTSST